MPSLIKLYDEFKLKNFVLLAIDVAESKKVVKKFATKEKLPFPVLMDVDGKVASAYGVRSHPAHFLINGNGELIGKAVGAKDWG